MFRPNTDPRRCSWLIVGLIVLLALGLRLGWSLSRPADEGALAALPDQVEYLALGRSLLAGERLSMADARFNDVVYAFRMPGYPLLCAACNGSVRTIRVVQGVIDASTVLATIWLARRWLSPRLSYLAGLIVALDPIYLYFSSLILSETLFASMLAWGMACLVHGASPMARGSRREMTLWWVGAVLLVLSIYVRPSALVMPLVLAIGSLAVEVGSTAFKPGRRVPVATLVALLTAVALLPWGIRNRALLGEWIFTTTNDGFTLYDGLNRSADGSSDQSMLAELPLLANLSETQRSTYLRTLAIDAAKAEPLRVIKLVPEKVRRTWSPWPLSAEYRSKRLYVLGAAAHAVPLFTAALLALLPGRLPRSAKVYLLLPAIVITILHAFSVGSLRYRMPAHTGLAVLAVSLLARPPRVVVPGSHDS